MAGFGHDPRNEPGGPVRNGNAQPGIGHGQGADVVGDGGGDRSAPRDLFGSYDSENTETGRAWRESGREEVERWFDEGDAKVLELAKGKPYHDSNRSRLQNLLDHMYTQAMRGGMAAGKQLVEIRIGKTVAQQEVKTGAMDDGVAFGEEAKKMTEALRAELAASGVDTSLIDGAEEDYLWSDERAEESPADGSLEA